MQPLKVSEVFVTVQVIRVHAGDKPPVRRTAPYRCDCDGYRPDTLGGYYFHHLRVAVASHHHLLEVRPQDD